MTAAERAESIRMLRRWCLDLNVDAYAKSVLHVLIQYINDYCESFPSIARIARESGMSPRKARAVIRKLEATGCLLVQQSNGRTTNGYRLCANPAPSAALERRNPAHKAGLNPARRAAFEYANPAPQVYQPGTACRLLVRNGVEDAGQGANSPDNIGIDIDIDLREVEV